MKQLIASLLLVVGPVLTCAARADQPPPSGVVNLSSSAGKRPSGLTAEYSVAKAALLSLSRVYADRYAKEGVLVNAVCPGPVKSELWMADVGALAFLVVAQPYS